MDDKNHIQAIIAGFSGVGKTTVFDLFREALKNAGFSNLTLMDEGSVVMTSERRELCVASLIENNTSIGIQTRLMRSPITNMTRIPLEEKND